MQTESLFSPDDLRTFAIGDGKYDEALLWAADEIERLRAELARRRSILKDAAIYVRHTASEDEEYEAIFATPLWERLKEFEVEL